MGAPLKLRSKELANHLANCGYGASWNKPLQTMVAINISRKVMSQLERLTPLGTKKRRAISFLK